MQQYYGFFRTKLFFSESLFQNLTKEVWLSSELYILAEKINKEQMWSIFTVIRLLEKS